MSADNATLILNKIKEYNSIIILAHQNPDGDAYGSQIGLKKLINLNFPGKHVYTPNTALNYLKFAYENEIGPEPTAEVYKKSLLIVVDTANKERINSELWENSKFKIQIDHHIMVSNDQRYADLMYIEPEMPSATSVIFELIEKWNLKMDKDVAWYLYLGLVTDTGRFLYPSMPERALETGSKLVSYGVDIKTMYQKLYQTPMNIVRFHGYVLSEFKTVDDNRIAYLTLTNKVLEKFKISVSEATAQVNLLASLTNVQVWFIACENKNDKNIKISIRSNRLAINSIATQFNGGGHAFASGAKVKDWKEFETFIEVIANFVATNQ